MAIATTSTESKFFEEQVSECERKLSALNPNRSERDESCWAAGFFDGEGHVSAGSRPGEISCSIEQIEDDLINLVRFKNVVGVGRLVRLNRQKRGNSRPLCRWSVSSQADLTAVYKKIGPFLNPAKLNGRPAQLKDLPDTPKDGFARALAVPFQKILSRDLAMPKGSLTHEIRPRKPNG